MASTAPLPANMAQAIIAPVMMGDSFNLILYGFVLSIFFSHLSTSSWSRASLLLKSLTFFVMALATLMAAIDLSDIWHFSTLQDRQLVALINGTLVECVKPLILGVIGVLVQSVLVARTSKALPNQWYRAAYLVLFGLLMILELSASITVTLWSVHFHRTLSFTGFLRLDFPACQALWMWSAAFTDLVITVVYLVSIWKNLKGSSEVVQNVMKLIIRLTLQSALPTTIFALATAIVTQIVLNTNLMTTLIPYAFWNPLPSLYALSLFTTLSIAERATQTAQIWTPTLHSNSRMNGDSTSGAHGGGVTFFSGSMNLDLSRPESSMSPQLGSGNAVQVPLFVGETGRRGSECKGCKCHCGEEKDVERDAGSSQGEP